MESTNPVDQLYKCKRCGLTVHRISNIKAHLQRKKPCQDVLCCGKSVVDLLKEINTNQTRHLGRHTIDNCQIDITINDMDSDEVKLLKAEIIRLRLELEKGEREWESNQQHNK
jgi:hypothetical protein